MLRDTDRGFHLTFENGYTVAVQWNPGNYCNNRNEHNLDSSKNAEVAIWHEDGGEYIRLKGWDDDVQGWYSADEVAELINHVKNWRESRER